MVWKPAILCSSHTISGVMPGGPVPARHGFEARATALRQADYDGLCLHLRDYRALRAQGHDDAFLVAILERHGLRCHSVEFLLEWFLEGEAGAQSRDDEATAYRAAQAFGAHTLNVGSDFAGRDLPRETMRARFRELTARAMDHGLSVALEIVPWSDAPDVDAAMDMIGDCPNAGLVIDCWHVFRGGVPLAEIGRIPGDRILDVQINDADAEIRGSLVEDTLNRRACGKGSFDLAAFLATVASTGTTAPLSVEIISQELAAMDAATAASFSIAGVRELLAQKKEA
ncbi:sugar phosphate isomerase/epimerase [Aquamicrobium sp. LC103]|uniref:sugar phosphate isomerase/epimerase family protein n=1 Tax=Aquamicrobium sp. LC103 TaxID=1120658 RepID=UPI000AE123DA|nr:sugar phosphate isomerase/epimerase [Aquamicrobium sp. LC103]